MRPVSINPVRFWKALNRKRVRDGLSWRQLAALVGVAPSTLTRMSAGHLPSANGYVRLLAWLHPPKVMCIDFITGLPLPPDRGTE